MCPQLHASASELVIGVEILANTAHIVLGSFPRQLLVVTLMSEVCVARLIVKSRSGFSVGTRHKFAVALRASADELLGLQKRKASTVPAAPMVERTLARRFVRVQALPRRDRDALTRTIDAFLERAAPA